MKLKITMHLTRSILIRVAYENEKEKMQLEVN